MKALTGLIVGMGALAGVGEGVYMPWEAFESLYRERIEREVLMQTAPRAEAPQVHSIDEARYQLSIVGGDVKGVALVSGTIVGGGPAPIALFGPEVIVTGLDDVTGGIVVPSSGGQGISFLPNESETAFQLILSFFLVPGEAGDAHVVTLGVPPALQNSLELALPAGSRLLEHPGLRDTDGLYHFSATQDLAIRYLDEDRASAAAVAEIDTMARISVQKSRVFVTTLFQPVRPLPESLVLAVPAGARLISSSVQASRIRPLAGDRYALTLPPNSVDAFSIELALDAISDDGTARISLPAVEGNTGQHGRFVVEEPEDGQVTVEAPGLVAQLAVERLGAAFRAFAGESRFYMIAAAEEAIDLTVRRFATVRAPSAVLDSQSLYITFAESGDILSVLMMDVPPEVGTRLTLDAVAGAAIWSLRVNGADTEVYSDQEGSWIIPLAGGRISQIELAYLQSGAKIGLQGSVDAVVPATGLPSRELRVGVALPARVELLFVDGPVSTAEAHDWPLPSAFTGKSYFFTRSFYKGEGMALAVSYKEPLNHARAQSGVSP
jgi:hypothetical protein